MINIVYVPLDERPCNLLFPPALAAGTEFKVVTPPVELLGNKKQPADTDGLWEWLLRETQGADGAILSLDTLVYGGIVPSRLHRLPFEECKHRLSQLRKLKEDVPGLQVYALNLIMRCPQYSSSDEEPDYYGEWGREIFRQGYIRHRMQLGIAAEAELLEKKHIDAQLPAGVLNDYLQRRAVNAEVNRCAVELAKEGVIDFLVIPQDDAAPFGWTALDQQKVRDTVKELDVSMKVYMYPGADEAGCTLLARVINKFKNSIPLVYPRFSSVQGPFVVPLYEDRMLFESVKYHVLAAGGLLCSSISEADIVLLINAPGETMMESASQHHPNVGYNVMRNTAELIETADYLIGRLRKPCVIADVAFANGADLELIRSLREKKLLFQLAGYAGWNTSSNTLGTCIAQGMIYHHYGSSRAHLDFLSLRYTEDAGYCAFVRQYVKEHKLPGLGMDYFSVDGPRGLAASLVQEELGRFVERYINDGTYRVSIDDVFLPWSRMFEVGLKTHLISLIGTPGATC